MKKFVSFLTLALTLTLTATNVFAAEGDLVLPGEKWLAAFDKYSCEAGQTTATPRPEAFEKMNLQFEKVSSDNTLKNVLLVATFTEDQAPCRYNVILRGNTDTKAVYSVQSLAYSTNGGSTCSAGKATLDQLFSNFEYLYYGHPHRIAMKLAFSDAQSLCGANATHIAPEFVVKGRVPATVPAQ